jgi:hypothetical protein
VLSLSEVWDVADVYLCLVSLRNEAYEEFKWRVSCSRAFPHVVDVLGHWQPVGPIVLLKVAIEVEVLF